MAIILSLESSTNICSVALTDNGNLLSLKETDIQNAHSSSLTLYIEEVMKNAGVPLSAIDAVAVSKGPGSYTGLRIGVSTAKGLCYALNKPLIGVSTLQAMAYQMIKKDPSVLFCCPMIDARRMEVYYAIYDATLSTIHPVSAAVVDESLFADCLENKELCFFGDGSEKCISILEKFPHARFQKDIFPSAVGVAALAEELYHKGAFEDVIYFEPFYLKEFFTTQPKKIL